MATTETLTIREAQKKQPWTVPYSHAFVEAAKMHECLYATHTVLHASKTVGKLATVFEAADHTNHRALTVDQRRTVEDMSADLVTASLRLANLYGFDLASALARRVHEKNGVPIVDEEPTP